MFEELIKKIVKEVIDEALSKLDFAECGDYYPDVMDLKTAAKYLKVSNTWLYQNIESVPHFDMGGHKFLKDQLKQLCLDKTGRSFRIR